MRKPKVNEPKMAGGILGEIEAHLAPLGWYYEELYENNDLVNDLKDFFGVHQDLDRFLASEECDLGVEYYKGEKKKIRLFYRKSNKARGMQEYHKADVRSMEALERLSKTRREREYFSKQMAELGHIIATLEYGDRRSSRLPSAYGEEALLP